VYLMNNEDKSAEEMSKLVLDVYSYALSNNIDITNQEEITKIVAILRPETSSEVNIDVLIQGLVALDRMTKDRVAKEPVSN